MHTSAVERATANLGARFTPPQIRNHSLNTATERRVKGLNKEIEMNGYENTIRKYQTLNSFANVGGAIVFGGAADLDVPFDELKQSFNVDYAIYNRSVAGLTVADASEVYDAVVAPLRPSKLLLRLGEADVETFEKNADEFVRLYRATLDHIRSLNKKCEIAIVSVGANDASSSTVAAMNESLSKLAASERCFFENVDSLQQRDSLALKETVSFVYSTGFFSPFVSTPIHSLAKILYGWNASTDRQGVKKNQELGRTKSRLNLTTVPLF